MAEEARKTTRGNGRKLQFYGINNGNGPYQWWLCFLGGVAQWDNSDVINVSHLPALRCLG